MRHIIRIVETHHWTRANVALYRLTSFVMGLVMLMVTIDLNSWKLELRPSLS